MSLRLVHDFLLTLMQELAYDGICVHMHLQDHMSLM